MRNESDIILPLLHRYAIAIDAQKWELFDEVFTPDVVANYTNSTWVSLRDWKRDFAIFHADFDATQHTISNATWKFVGSTAFAISYSVVRRIRNAAANGEFIETGCWYDDEIIPVGDDFRINRRTCRIIWRKHHKLEKSDEWASLATAVRDQRVGHYFGAASAGRTP
jgi:hypothetical protein